METLDDLHVLKCIKIFDVSYERGRMGSGVVYDGFSNLANYQLYG